MRDSFLAEATPHLSDYWHNSDDYEKTALTAIALLEREGKGAGRSFRVHDLLELCTRSEQTISRLEKRAVGGFRRRQVRALQLFIGRLDPGRASRRIERRADVRRVAGGQQKPMERLSGGVHNELSEVLPKIGAKYRDMVVTWASDPAHLAGGGATLEDRLDRSAISRCLKPSILILRAARSPGSEMFFGREDVFEFVKRTLSGKHRDNVIVLYGQRRTGKTSVLYHISRHLDPEYLCVFVDLHALALEGVGGLLWELANYMVRGLRRDYGIEMPRPNQPSSKRMPAITFATNSWDRCTRQLATGICC